MADEQRKEWPFGFDPASLKRGDVIPEEDFVEAARKLVRPPKDGEERSDRQEAKALEFALLDCRGRLEERLRDLNGEVIKISERAEDGGFRLLGVEDQAMSRGNFARNVRRALKQTGEALDVKADEVSPEMRQFIETQREQAAWMRALLRRRNRRDEGRELE